MMEPKHTISDLYQMQALPLSAKIKMTNNRIRQWVEEYGGDGVYISFSGGKDSTVLLHLVRKLYPTITAVFCDTGLEYPEVRSFAMSVDNLTVLKPKYTFKQVIERYGYPFISKEVSGKIKEFRSFRDRNEDVTKYYRYEAFAGTLTTKDGSPSRYNYKKYAFALDAPFKISNQCCDVMKKKPIKQYEKETGKHPFTGQMAEESSLRTTQWIFNGCNGFHLKRPVSNPLSFWSEQDVLQYIKQNNIQIASVYGDIVEDVDKTGNIDGQLNLSDLDRKQFGTFNIEMPPLKTTGCNRTGCMFCGYGCHLEKESRFERMHQTHPKQYDYIMKPWEDGGLNYKAVIDWLNENGNLNIRY